MLKEHERLKIGLLANGMRVSQEARNGLSNGGQIPLSLFEYATTSGIPLRFSNTDIFVNAPFAEDFCKDTEYELDFQEGVFVVRGRDQRFPVTPIPLPSYFNKPNRKGKPFSSFAMTHTDRVRISPIAGCSFSCEFCDLSRSFEYQRKPLEELLESIKTAIDDPILPAKHILISGGTPKPQDWDYMDEVYRETARTFDIPVDVMMVPRPDLDYINRLHSWGINEISVNLEIYNEQIARQMIKGKSNIGQELYFKFLKKASEIFGRGNVRSMLLVGLEPLEDTLKGIEALARIGVSPVLSPFRPSPKTTLAHLSPPTAQQLEEVYERSREITEQYSLKLGPRCIPCQHNTLTFPDDSGEYFFN